MIDNLRTLPIEERIKIVEDLWDSIAADRNALSLTDAQKAELDRRLDAYELELNSELSMTFKEKLKKLNEENKEKFQQLEHHKQIWIREVKNLYQTIKEWFQEYVEEGYMSVDYFDLQSAECEEFLMETQIMELNLGGGPSVILEPTGINVVGAFGKIDLYQRGNKDEKIFLLLMENEENREDRHWEIWKSRKQQDRMKFDKETFETLLDEWLEKWASVQ